MEGYKTGGGSFIKKTSSIDEKTISLAPARFTSLQNNYDSNVGSSCSTNIMPVTIMEEWDLPLNEIITTPDLSVSYFGLLRGK